MGKLIDLSGERFGFWLALEQGLNNKSGKTQWLCECECECGIKKLVTTNSLRTGNSTSCGCNHAPDLINQKFDNFIIIDKKSSNGRRYWICECKCGKIFTETTNKIRNSIVTSCGCNFAEDKSEKINFEDALKSFSFFKENLKKFQIKTNAPIDNQKSNYENLCLFKKIATDITELSIELSLNLWDVYSED